MTGAGITVGLLGHLDVRRDDAPVRLQGRQAVLLAALALSVGTVVSYPTLTAYLWPDSLPQNHRRTLQTYAGRLRALLGSATVVSRPEGLRLALDPDCVDLARFRALVVTARGSDQADELTLLEQARGLWRGQPLSGLSPDALEREHGSALTEELLGITERVHELRLETGRADEELVSSLRLLTSQYPWRERSWEQLMLALCRQGRQGEALLAFHQLAGVLRDDLGIEPGAEIARLHQRILAGDPELTRPVDARTTRVRPAQLPAGTPGFVGRRSELDDVNALLTEVSDRVRVAVVTGPAGVGKTALALEAAHQARHAFPDGQLFRRLSGSGTATSAFDVLGGFLRDLGVHAEAVPPTEGERSGLFRSMCAERRLLVVLDDVQSADQIEAVVPGAGGCAVVVTCRRHSALPANLRLDLGVMAPAESQELLATIVAPERLAAEPEATAAIVAACGGSALALRIVAGRLAIRPTWSIAHLAGRLTGAGRLDELRLEGASVRVALDAVVDGLEPEVATRFRRLSVLPAATADADIAAVAWDIGTAEAQRTLDELCDIRLLEPAATALYTWHDLVHDYLGASAEAMLPGRGTLLLHYLIRSLLNAKAVLRPDDRAEPDVIASIDDVDGRAFHGRSDIHAWLHPRWGLLVAAARHALGSDDPRGALEAAAMAVLLDNVTSECCQRGTDHDTLLTSVIEADLPAEGRRFTAAAWHNLATNHWERARQAEAIDAGEHAIALWRSLGDRYGEAIMLNNAASGHMRQRDYRTALVLLRQCVEAGDVLPPTLRTRCLLNLAETCVCLGEVGQAREWVTAARALGEPDPVSFVAYRERVVMAQLGRALGDEIEAVDAAESAVATARAIQSTTLEAQALLLLAQTRRLLGLPSGSAAADAAQTASRHRHFVVHAEALVELGHAHHLRAEPQKAEASWRAASSAFDALGIGDTAAVKTLLAEIPSPTSDLP
ncbi:MAG TPA: BTAD domain-containing putative transcriptional regulator [Jiangellaceae bacterium]